MYIAHNGLINYRLLADTTSDPSASDALLEQYTLSHLVDDIESSAEVQPAQAPAHVSEGWSDEVAGEQHSAGGDASNGDVSTKKVVKELIEKHTIETVNLENKLQTKESNEIKEVLEEFEERKAKAIEQEKEALSQLLPRVDGNGKLEAVSGSAECLQVELATIEEEKVKVINSVIEKLVEEHLEAKDTLVK